MNRLFTFLFFSAAFTISLSAQTWDEDDHYPDQGRGNNRQGNNPNQQWNNPNQGWQQGNGYDYNPYQDPNYYPQTYRGCTPPPPCRRNVVVVTPPPSYCAPVVIAPMRPVYYRPYRYNPYRSYGYGHGWGPRRWRGR
jgi:hypothetical protein